MLYTDLKKSFFVTRRQLSSCIQFLFSLIATRNYFLVSKKNSLRCKNSLLILLFILWVNPFFCPYFLKFRTKLITKLLNLLENVWLSYNIICILGEKEKKKNYFYPTCSSFSESNPTELLNKKFRARKS